MDRPPFELEPKVAAWKQSLAAGGCSLNALTPLKLLYKKNGELLFALLSADISDPQGRRLPPYIFIRGNACIVVVRITNQDSGEEAFLMMRQRRIGNGWLNLEFPAGMLDRNIDDPASVALRELAEETGLIIPAEALFPLCDKPLLSSAGASDEGVHYFGACVIVSGKRFNDCKGRSISNDEENEHIQLYLCTRQQAEEETVSLQARLGLYLFSDYVTRLRPIPRLLP